MLCIGPPSGKSGDSRTVTITNADASANFEARMVAPDWQRPTTNWGGPKHAAGSISLFTQVSRFGRMEAGRRQGLIDKPASTILLAE